MPNGDKAMRLDEGRTLYNDLAERIKNIPSVDNVVAVTDVEPTEEGVKIWLPETPPQAIQVPTYAEFQELEQSVGSEAYFISKKSFTNPTTVNSNASSVINAALTAARTAGKNYCVIPEGEYWLTETIYLQDGVILKGCGMDATTLKIADNCDIDAIRVAGPINNSGIMDLAIDGNRITNYSTFSNGHHGNAINVWLHYGRIERVRTNWVYKHSLLLNYDTGNGDDGLGFDSEHQNDMGNLNKVLWCDFRDSLLQGVMWGWRTMDSWMCYTNIGSHAANLYLEGGTSRFIGNHFDGDGDNGAGPEYNVYCGDGCTAMLFDGNIFENTQKQNIFFRQPSYSNQTMTITISNNIIRTCSKSQNEQYPNIYISGYSDSVKATEIAITGNQILNPDTNANHGYAGIHLAYCDNCKIIGNTFFNVGSNEIVIDNTCSNILNDISMSNPVFTGSISMGRVENTTVGEKSTATGTSVTASGSNSHAEGGGTTASGAQSHAEGGGTTASGSNSHSEGAGSEATNSSAHAEGTRTTASGDSSHSEGSGTTASGYSAHAEGAGTTASGSYSHAEGASTIAASGNAHAEGGGTQANAGCAHAEGSTTRANGSNSHSEGGGTIANGDCAHAEGGGAIANGMNSHAEGGGTIANGGCSHAGGKNNVPDDYSRWDEWVANTSYSVGDKVKRTVTENNETTVTGYICKTANNDSTFTSSKWTLDLYMNYAEIIGNGSTLSATSNARALDWSGNEYLKGNVYVGCNYDSTGGTMLPTDVQVNGTSVVNNGVANIPVASANNLGVVKTQSNRGLTMSSGIIQVNSANVDAIKSGMSGYLPIVPYTQYASAFYGLAKAAGDATQSASSNAVGTYTPEAKTAIQTMLGVEQGVTFVETVTGTTPTITGQPNVRYICGEVSLLTITPPSAGTITVIFESGSTPTVLTLPNTVKFPEWVDISTLEANTTYELIITDGVYGGVMSWAD